jgi:ABC-2 type transport system permease protein
VNLRRLWAIVRKESIHARRDTRTVVIVLLMPLLQLILLGYTTMNDIEQIPMAVCDLSHSARSRDLISAYSTTRVFAITQFAANENEVVRLLEAGTIQVGMVIPPDYAETLARRQKAQVALYLDGSNPTIALAAVNSAQFVAQSKSTEMVRVLAGGSSAGVFHISALHKYSD